MRDVRIGTLQWAVGAFCATTGTLMLVAPHQYRLPEYALLRLYLPWLGVAEALGGVALLGVLAFSPPRSLSLLAHSFSSIALLVLAGGFFGSHIWTGTVSYLLLATATLLAPLLPRRREERPSFDGDLFALAIAAAAAVNGVLFLFLPQLFTAPFYAVPRPYLPLYGLAFLGSGLALTFTQLLPAASPRAIRASSLAVAGSFYAFGLPNLEASTWTGVAYYGGFGLLVALLPWLPPRWRRIDMASLRARMALSLTAATVIPLSLVMAVETEQIQHAGTAQQLNRIQAETGELARQVAARLGEHRAMTAAVSSQPGLMSMAPEAQRALLHSLYVADPGGLGLATFDAAGAPVAQGGDISFVLGDFPGLPILDEARSLPEGSARQSEPPLSSSVRLLFWASLLDRKKEFAGVAVTAIGVSHLVDILSQADLDADDEAFLVDRHGHVLAKTGAASVDVFQDLSSLPPVASLLAGEVGPRALSYQDSDRERFAAFARVPDLGWGVVVERSSTRALASVLRFREAAAYTLLLVTLLSLAAGAMEAVLLAAPLRAFARAVEKMGHGDLRAPLPGSGIAEIARLAASFGEMRDRLEARTAEREEAEEAIRFLAEASSVLSSSLDYETTLASTARLAVPRLADWCVLEVMDEDGHLHHLAIAHREPGKEPLLRTLHERYQFSLEGSHPVAAAVRTGVPQLMEEVPPDAMAGMGHDQGLVAGLLELGVRSVLAVPLRARGRILGAIMLVVGESGRRYRHEDLAMAEELARRCAQAVDNARLYQEAQRAIRARDEFLSVAAHELKTPMTSLRGFAQVVLRQWEKEGVQDPGRVQRALQVIDLQSEKLSRLVVQLLDVSRIQGGRLVLYRERAELTGLVEGVLATARAVTSRHDLVLEPSSPAWAMVDPLRLEQVVTNLVDNAIKYSPAGGEIRLKLSIPNPGIVRLEVRDHGIGIPPEHRSRVFDRFYQVNGGDHAGGMGLGLYISHHIVDLHGGRIEVEFPPDGGTRFIVTLPAEDGHEPGREEGGEPWA